MTLPQLRTVLLAGLAALPLIALAAPAARADDEAARVDRLEKQVRELRSIVFQAKDTGRPVEVKVNDGPDPAIAALAQRVDDLEATLRRLQGSAEVSNHDAEVSRTGLDAERADRAAQIQQLSDRIARLEGGAAAVAAPAAAPPPPPAPLASTKGVKPARGTDLATATQAAAPVAAPPAGGDAAAEFKTARTLLANGDYAGATGAFQSFIEAHPGDAKTPEAYYWLGDSYLVRDLNGDATAAYARALKGWPKTTWAPDAVVKLARSLAATQRQPEACAALNEFTRRYGTSAPAATRTRAAQTRAKVGCD
jgi:tol-pal system protein YbgF